MSDCVTGLTTVIVPKSNQQSSMAGPGCEWSACCLPPLPMVYAPKRSHGPYVTAMAPLFDNLAEYTDHERDVIKKRFIPMIDATEREAKRAEWWDTRMFMLGFGGSLLVAILAAISIASFVSANLKDIMGTLVLLVSSVGTAALGLRERLKFKESASISRRLSCKLQRRGFLFLARAEPYNSPDRQEAYCDFVRHTELLKMQADEERLALSEEQDMRSSVEVSTPFVNNSQTSQPGSGAAGGNQWMAPSVPMSPQLRHSPRAPFPHTRHIPEINPTPLTPEADV